MRRSLTAAVMAAATLLAGGATGTATASESPSPSSSSSEASVDVATPLERVRAYTQPSIVYIETEYTGYVYDTFNKAYINNGQPVTTGGSCTGFVVSPDGYIATAGHCVNIEEVGEGALLQRAAELALEQGYYASPDLTVEDVIGFNDYVFTDQTGRRQKPTMKVTVAWAQSAGGVQTSKGLPARVVKKQKFSQGDGAVLKVEESGLNALPIADEGLEVGTDVITIGYPGSVDAVTDPDFTPSFKEGSVSSKKTVGGGLTTVWEISAEISKGMSGGPTVNLDGEVVGVISFYPTGETQSFNFIQPSSVIQELLGDAGQENILSEDTQAYRAGLDALFAGDKATAIENLELVVDNQPTNELAKEYLDQAQELPDPPAEEESSSDDGGSNLGMIIGIVVALLVLAAIVAGVLMAMSKKKKSGATTPSQGYTPPPVAGGQAYPQQYGGPGTAPGATSTAVLTPPSTQPTPPSVAPSIPPPTSPSASAPSAAPPAPASAPPPAPASASPPPPAPASAPTPAPPPAPTESTSPPAVDVFCSNCGTKGEAGQKFCKQCGTAL